MSVCSNYMLDYTSLKSHIKCRKFYSSRCVKSLLEYTLDDEKFLLYTNDEYGSIFASKRCLEFLKTAFYWSSDGTFKFKTSDSAQTYVILVSQNEMDTFIPIVHMLMKNKKYSTYKHLYNVLLKEIGLENMEGINVIMDMEPAVSKLYRKYKEKIHYCYFHILQAWRRKLISLGYKNILENIDGPITRSSDDSEKIRILLKLLGKIFHLPPNYIKTGYYIIKEEITKISKNRFKKYFLFIENNYICKNLEEYTLYKRYNRTNNASESYNSAVNRDLMCIKNKNLSKVCESIKIQEFKISMQILTGKYSSSRSQTTIIKNEKYKELYETFDQSNIFTYLTMF